MEALWGFTPGQNGKFCVSAIDDENIFIHHVVLANLSKEDTVELIASVLLAVSGRQASERWITATVSSLQLAALGMHIEPDETAETEALGPLGFADEEDLARLFMEAPTPVCMMTGPDHVFTFMNQPLVRMMGRLSPDEILGKPVREALGELEGQSFFKLLDQVYETGEPYIGIEVPAKLYHADLSAYKETFLDFVYHPVRNRDGNVCGILCQSTDVTERVLEKHVRESREEQLYRQWAEMDAIYRESPVAMCLLEAKTFKILRLNKVKAQMLGDSIENLVGKIATELPIALENISAKYREVLRTKQPTSFEAEMEIPGRAGERPIYLWNLNPVFSLAGEVESIASVVVEVSDRPTRLSAERDSVGTASL